jgi:lysophospholipase L1-like esterase
MIAPLPLLEGADMTLKLAVASLFIAVLALLAFSPGARAQSAAPKRIVCFGDSITEGYKVTDAFTTPYPSMLQKLFDDKEGKGSRKVVNAGISGQDTRQALKRIDSVLEKEKPDVFIILYGTNDLWTSRKIADDETEKNLREIVSKAKASGARCIIGTMIPVWDFDAKVAARNEVIRRVAKEAGIGLVDTNAAFEKALKEAGDRSKTATWEKYYQVEDGGFVHPNDRGNEVLATAVRDAILAS